MLIGEYIHTIDEKNRISLPAKFRKEMGKVVIITPGLDKCLFIFTMKEWEKVSKKLSDTENDLSFLKADQRSFNRNMFGQAVDVEVDSIGRILIPENLKEKINISGKAALIGVKEERRGDEVLRYLRIIAPRAHHTRDGGDERIKAREDALADV